MVFISLTANIMNVYCALQLMQLIDANKYKLITKIEKNFSGKK